ETILEGLREDVADDDAAAGEHAERDGVGAERAAARPDADGEEEQRIDQRVAGIVVGMAPARRLAADAGELAVGAIEEGRDDPEDAGPDIGDIEADGEEGAGEE